MTAARSRRGVTGPPLAVTLLALASLSATPVPETFTGVITDSECAAGSHADMRMGPTDGECVKACVDAHGALYVLRNDARTYELGGQGSPQALAGRAVIVIGTLSEDGGTIQVESIAARQP